MAPKARDGLRERPERDARRRDISKHGRIRATASNDAAIERTSAGSAPPGADARGKSLPPRVGGRFVKAKPGNKRATAGGGIVGDGNVQNIAASSPAFVADGSAGALWPWMTVVRVNFDDIVVCFHYSRAVACVCRCVGTAKWPSAAAVPRTCCISSQHARIAEGARPSAS
jgi:hypothetical protein